MKFLDIISSSEVLVGVNRAGFVDCTQVQEKVLPISLSGKDVMVQSKTGSGKTAVFLLTILERFMKNGRKGKALVISPTRELAVQIEEDAKILASGVDGYHIGCFFGGVGYNKQDKELENGVDLYVGTPGRLIDYAKDHKIDFRQFDIVVLDEADRMFDMGFYPDIQYMFSIMRDTKDRQTMLFSATLSTKVRNLAWQYMNEPEEIEVQPEEITVKNITQELFHVTKEEKFPLLLSILKKIAPKSCLVFTNTKDRAQEVSKRLAMNGYKAEYLMGDMAQSKRLQTIDRMKAGKLHFLVATDVAARGLQIDDLELVVNYDIPEDYENYVHRIGRTARAGKSGKAITLACEEYIYGLEAIEEFIQMKIPVLWPDECGLEEVEDKSAGYSYQARRKDTFDRRPNRNKSSSFDRKDRGNSTNKRANKNKKPVRKENREEKIDDKELSKLSAMSLEERMAYYKNTYSKNTKDTAKAKGDKRTNTAKNSDKPDVKAPVEKKEEKKKSVFERIVAFFKGKK